MHKQLISKAMGENKSKLEFEKLKTEVDLLKRELLLNTDEKDIELRNKEVQNNHKQRKLENNKSSAALIFSILSILLTSLVAFYSVKTNNEISTKRLTVHEDELRLNQFKRIDKLRVDFDNPETSNRRRASIAYELACFTDTATLPIRERDFYRDFYENHKRLVAVWESSTRESNESLDTIQLSGFTEQEIEVLELADNLEQQLVVVESEGEKQIIEEQIDSLNKQISDSKLSKTISLLDTISANQIKVMRIDNTSESSPVQVTWFKEGYYRNFGHFRIGLVKLDARKEYGKVKISIKRENEEYEAIETLDFFIPSKKIFNYDNKRFELNFLKVDRAGKNPFTKAVYFSFVE